MKKVLTVDKVEMKKPFTIIGTIYLIKVFGKVNSKGWTNAMLVPTEATQKALAVKNVDNVVLEYDYLAEPPQQEVVLNKPVLSPKASLKLSFGLGFSHSNFDRIRVHAENNFYEVDKTGKKL